MPVAVIESDWRETGDLCRECREPTYSDGERPAQCVNRACPLFATGQGGGVIPQEQIIPASPNPLDGDRMTVDTQAPRLVAAVGLDTVTIPRKEYDALVRVSNASYPLACEVVDELTEKLREAGIE